ncbi:hypothetical protein ABID21_000692 [Pseudorhizobium tarimense]|uniref:Bacteriophage lambda head decoration protein D n=1 Tax=Pseudorhizobium tarimense TaxID=1079109 RepID=A0ABV2H2H2_9HYPH|nr:hypothetical protein [Pseudorhizobium tarimense]MCJ8517793.1 hypothetical protein [Pseudorhizobium tarimense]
MTEKITVTVVKTFPVSGRSLCLTDESGALTGGVHKDGSPLSQSFTVGAVALQEKDGSCIAGPVDFWDVIGFAERIIEGDQRALTAPVASLLLATALVGIARTWPLPGTAPAMTREAV